MTGGIPVFSRSLFYVHGGRVSDSLQCSFPYPRNAPRAIPKGSYKGVNFMELTGDNGS